MARTSTGESVLSRAVRIFDAFTPDDRVLSVSQIARRSGLHLATASRLIAELQAHGLLDRDPDRRVRVGVRMWELAVCASPTVSLRAAGRPFMADAHAVLGHHVLLGVLDGDEVRFVERLSARGAVIDYTRIAGRLPLHASSSGLVLLAYGGGELRERILGKRLRRYTDATITEATELRTALAEVRRQGYAYLPGHVHEDALGVAVPIPTPVPRDIVPRDIVPRDTVPRDTVPREGPPAVAALAAVLPVGTEARAVVGVLSTAARGISRTLGDSLYDASP